MNNWAKRHPNTTVILSYIISFWIIGYCAWNFVFPPNTLYVIVELLLGIWILKQKHRSMRALWWLVVIILCAGARTVQSGTTSQEFRDFLSYYSYTLGFLGLPVIIWLCMKNKRIEKWEKE